MCYAKFFDDISSWTSGFNSGHDVAVIYGFSNYLDTYGQNWAIIMSF